MHHWRLGAFGFSGLFFAFGLNTLSVYCSLAVPALFIVSEYILHVFSCLLSFRPFIYLPHSHVRATPDIHLLVIFSEEPRTDHSLPASLLSL